MNTKLGVKGGDILNVQDFLIDEESTMLEAMESLSRVAKKVLFVVRNGYFVGAITDGDIRRWILKKGNLEAKIKNVANYNPKFLYEKEKTLAKAYMRKNSIEAVPILNEDKEARLWLKQ